MKWGPIGTDAFVVGIACYYLVVVVLLSPAIRAALRRAVHGKPYVTLPQGRGDFTGAKIGRERRKRRGR